MSATAITVLHRPVLGERSDGRDGGRDVAPEGFDAWVLALRGAAVVGAVYAVTLTAFATVTWLQFWAHR